MDRFSLLFESPPWLIGIGVLIGMAYAAILYYKAKVTWGKNINYILAGLRFLMITQLTLLLFGPLIRQIQNTKELPSLVFAIDNSQSIAEIENSISLVDFENNLKSLQQAFNQKGYLTEI